MSTAPPVRERTTALVLAGGRSRRFGSDKLAAMLEGRPLLEHALLAATATCAQVLLVRRPDDAGPPLATDLAARVEVVGDERAFEGPLAAALHAASRAHGDRLLLIGGDMPSLVPALLGRLLGFESEREGACLLVGGEAVPLPLAVTRAALSGHGSQLVAEGERSLRSLLRRADLETLPEAEWRRLDPAGDSLRDVDRPEDLVSVEGNAPG
jgi:molybdopterin-guanine dinucleotide biosynthesis protein A